MTDRICIVGAGPGGIAMARACRAFGLDYDQFERHTDFGGIWDPDNTGTPIYEHAHFISSKTRSAFIGSPMPDDFPDYPRWNQVLAYLRSVAEAGGLRDGVRFSTPVSSARRMENGGWEVTLGDGSTHRYAGLACATGGQWAAMMPSYPGSFDGEIRHSNTYWSPAEMAGKRVLVVGGGNSAFDIACEVSRTAAHTAISLRRGYRVIPKHIFGMPTDVFAQSGPHLPNRVAQPMLGALMRLIVGDQTKFGLPKPDHKLLSSHPVLNSQVFHLLSHGLLTLHRDVERYDGPLVRFTDGRSATFDVVLCATGFQHSIPYVAAGSFPITPSGRPKLGLATFFPPAADAWVVGLFETNSGGYHLMDRVAVLAAQAFSDRSNPSVVAEVLQATDLRGGIKFVDSPRHEDYVDNHALEHRIAEVTKKFGWQTAEATLGGSATH